MLTPPVLIVGSAFSMSKSLFGILTGVIVPVLLFLITPFWGTIFSDTKSVTYDVVEKKKVSEISADEYAGSKIRLSYNGRDIKQGTFLTVAIENGGKSAIRKEDFYSDIFIEVGGGDVLVAQVLETQPANIPLSISQSKSRIAIKPLLINAGDRFLIKIFSDNDIRIDGVHSRILGVSEIDRVQSPESLGLVVKTLKPLEGGGTAEMKVMALKGPWVLWLNFIILLGTFLSWIVFLRVAGWPKILFLLLAVSLYGSSLAMTTIASKYLITIVGLSKVVALIVAFSQMGAVGLVVLAARKKLSESFRGVEAISNRNRLN